MTFLKSILVGAIGLALHTAATAQIYESEGAGGVPEFSDTPKAGAEVVDLPATNLAEPPPEGESAPAAGQPAPRVVDSAAGEPGQVEGEYGGVYYADDEDELEARRRAEEGRVHEALQDHPEAVTREAESGTAVEHAEGRAVHQRAHGGRR